MTTATGLRPSTAQATANDSTPPASVAPTVAADQPGRWVGGLVGALTSLAAAVIAGVVTKPPAILGWDSWSAIGLLGMPIAYILGRELLPMARGAGWRRAVSTGMLLGWAAPPLGAVEILGGSRLLDFGDSSSAVAGPLSLVLLPIALPLSFLAIFMTMPVGLAWGVLVRLIPEDLLVALRVPPPLEHLGVRHVMAVVAVALLLLELAVRS